MFISGQSLKPIDFAGLIIFDYTAGCEVSSSLAISDVPSGAHHAEAWSKRSDKYYLVIAGMIRFVLEGVENELGTRDFCLVSRGRHFSYSNPAAAPATRTGSHAQLRSWSRGVYPAARL